MRRPRNSELRSGFSERIPGLDRLPSTVEHTLMTRRRDAPKRFKATKTMRPSSAPSTRNRRTWPSQSATTARLVWGRRRWRQPARSGPPSAAVRDKSAEDRRPTELEAIGQRRRKQARKSPSHPDIRHARQGRAVRSNQLSHGRTATRPGSWFVDHAAALVAWDEDPCKKVKVSFSFAFRPGFLVAQT